MRGSSPAPRAQPLRGRYIASGSTSFAALQADLLGRLDESGDRHVFRCLTLELNRERVYMKKTALPDTHEIPLGKLEPRHPTLWASLAFALAKLTLAWPGLTGAILFNPRSDQYTNGYGFRYFVEVWLRDGKGFPQWDPFLQGGVPYVAGMHGDVFCRRAWPSMLVTSDDGRNIKMPRAPRRQQS